MKLILSFLPLMIPGIVLISLFVQVLSRHPDKYYRISSTFCVADPALLPTGQRRFLILPKE